MAAQGSILIILTTPQSKITTSGERIGSGFGFIAGQCPTNEGIGVTMAHLIFGFKIIDDLHVLLYTAIVDNFLLLSY